VKILRRSKEAAQWCEAYRRAALSVGFVPTLGGLHEGHLSLVRQASIGCDRVVASIYLNPAQFNSTEDLDEYPSDLESDLEACRAEGVDLVLVGEQEEFLPDNFQSWVLVEDLARGLCGAGRPGHFRGVCTVVTQLFHVVRPHRAYFGLKDFQQARIVTKLSEELLFGVDVCLGPTIRSSDGLALSSRNDRLTEAQRAAAPVLYEALVEAKELVLAGEASVEAVKEFLRGKLDGVPGCELEYAEVLSAATLDELPGRELNTAGEGVLLAIAARFGETRLIDNIRISGDGDFSGPGPGRERGS
jgi:pantoate--beta-alanine ligase